LLDFRPQLLPEEWSSSNDSKTGQLQKTKIVKQKKCQYCGYLTVKDGGRLGNQIGQYATLIGHGKKLGAQLI
jgi:hypothetical protein